MLCGFPGTLESQSVLCGIQGIAGCRSKLTAAAAGTPPGRRGTQAPAVRLSTQTECGGIDPQRRRLNPPACCSVLGCPCHCLTLHLRLPSRRRRRHLALLLLLARIAYRNH